MRVLGDFAIVVLCDGAGFFADGIGCDRRIGAGATMMLFPEIAQAYGPVRPNIWSELYIIFSGRVFDGMRDSGLISEKRPIGSDRDPARTLAEVSELFDTGGKIFTPQEQAGRIYKFAEILTRLVSPEDQEQALLPRWLSSAQSILSQNLERELELQYVAEQVGMSYELFRKRFREATLLSPGKFRACKRIESACTLLADTPLTCARIADSLGFGDEFQFSRRFKQFQGISPSKFRSRALGKGKP